MDMNLNFGKYTPDEMKSIIDDFFTQLNEMKHHLSSEDMKNAMDSLEQAVVFAKRIENENAKEEEKKRLEELKAKEKEEKKTVESVTCMDLPLDWENAFAGDERAQIRVNSIPDALITSLVTLGKVDIQYIAEITGEDCKTVIEELRGSIYQNPDKWQEVFYEGWESADEYLSGNLIHKFNVARKANEKYKGYFEANVKALEALLPPSVATGDIYVTLGSPWVPADIIDDFIAHIFNENPAFYKDPKSMYYNYRTRHDEATGTWHIPSKNRYRHGRQALKSQSTYGTKRMEMLYILENTLNMKTIAITDKVLSTLNKSGEKTVINEAETVLALEKQKKLVAEFQKWIWRDESRRDRLQMIYDLRYGAIRKRQFDGSFLTFPTMSDTISLFPYQKNAVARILFSPNTLLAHEVGSGKTYVMIAAGMELRRMGISKKNLYVVPNNITGQWKSIFLSMYPNANILSVTPNEFTKEKRNSVLRKIKYKDYDAIIMAYSCFDTLPLSMKFYNDLYNDMLREIENTRKALNENSVADRKKKSVIKALEKIKNELLQSTCSINFDELGITRLFVDEAHNYKNVPLETKVSRVLGISQSGSEKCRKMLDKVTAVQRANNGAGVIFATGTPITNSITDVYIMQKYLQAGELAVMGISSFDSWAGMFAEKMTDFEIDVDTNSYRLATRFSKFHNLPELTAILSSIADFHHTGKENGVPEHDGFCDSLIGRTHEFAKYLKDISSRADDVRKGKVSRTEDNMLKITTDGRKAALDIRLVDPKCGFTFQSKVAGCAENVADIYRRHSDTKSTQLIFCDTSTPKAGFNVYDELRRLLTLMGIPNDEIAYIHDASTESKRQKLFAAVRRGDVRVLIGSTFKLGIGVNIQDRLIAVHDIDLPWRPADLVQRQGRILRQGNMHEKVELHRYITEGSFDAYSWQLLETKQRFIDQILSGSMSQRSGEDVSDTALNYAEIKALAIGNPDIKKRVETANELNRLYLLQKEVVEEREAMKRELSEIPAKIERQLGIIERCEADIDFYRTNNEEYDKKTAKAIRETIDGAVKANAGKPEETHVLIYKGFRVVVPAFMDEHKPAVWLIREGKYYLELGTESGVTRRLEFFFDEFDRQLDKYNSALEAIRARQASLEEELERKVGYADKIEEYRKILNEIDEKLGVNKK